MEKEDEIKRVVLQSKEILEKGMSECKGIFSDALSCAKEAKDLKQCDNVYMQASQRAESLHYSVTQYDPQDEYLGGGKYTAEIHQAIIDWLTGESEER
jgi:hypothetical protein